MKFKSFLDSDDLGDGESGTRV